MIDKLQEVLELVELKQSAHILDADWAESKGYTGRAMHQRSEAKHMKEIRDLLQEAVDTAMAEQGKCRPEPLEDMLRGSWNRVRQ